MMWRPFAVILAIDCWCSSMCQAGTYSRMPVPHCDSCFCFDFWLLSLWLALLLVLLCLLSLMSHCLLCFFCLKPKSIPCVFAVLQLSEFVDHLTGLVSNTSKSS